MNDEIVTTSGGSSVLLRGILIALPFFLFLYYVQVSSEKIKELKGQINATPITETTTIIDTGTILKSHPDTALINLVNNISYENRVLHQQVDSLQTKIAVITPPPPSVNPGNDNMMADSFSIYKGLFEDTKLQLDKCRYEKENGIKKMMQNYIPKTPVIVK